MRYYHRYRWAWAWAANLMHRFGQALVAVSLSVYRSGAPLTVVGCRRCSQLASVHFSVAGWMQSARPLRAPVRSRSEYQQGTRLQSVAYGTLAPIYFVAYQRNQADA